MMMKVVERESGERERKFERCLVGSEKKKKRKSKFVN